MTIVNDDSRVVNKLEASLTDDARGIIYDRHMFIVQAAVVTIRSSLLRNNFLQKHYNYLQAYLQKVQTQSIIKVIKMPSYEGLG